MNILDYLSLSQQKKIKHQKYKKGSLIYSENDKCTSIGIVLSGQVSIVSYLEDGNEVVYNVIKENGIFGNNLIFSSSPYYKGNIITNEDSLIAFIPKNLLIELLSSNKEFMVEYLKIQSDFTKTLNNTIKLLSMDSAEMRLYYYLHENNNEIIFDSITDLSKKLFIQRETLSRLLSKLERQKKIKRNSNTIKLL